MALRNALGTGKGLAGHTGNRINAPRYSCNKALAILATTIGSGLAVHQEEMDSSHRYFMFLLSWFFTTKEYTVSGHS